MKYAFHLSYIQFVTTNITTSGTKYARLYFQIYCSPRKTVCNINFLCEVCEVGRGDTSIKNNCTLE